MKKSKTIHAVANKYRKSANLNVFDYIIDNKDRNEGNILLKDGREIAIDHGLSLRFINPIGEVLKVYDHLSWGLGANRHPVRQRWLHPKKDIHEFLADQIVISSLRQFSSDRLKKIVSPYLRKKRIKKLLHKTWRFLGYYELRKKPEL